MVAASQKRHPETCSPPSGPVSTDTEVELLGYPNLIFVTISHGSTAQPEGIERGILGMIAREQDIEDDVPIYNRITPIGNVEFIWTLIARCCDKEFYESLLRWQTERPNHKQVELESDEVSSCR